jgi:hypothetical protein
LSRRQHCFIHFGVMSRQVIRLAEIAPGSTVATEWDESPR